MEKLLTVSVATYNGAATLQKALESCLVADESLQALLDVIIIDDMISSGESMLDVAKQLKERNAKRVFVCTTYGLFTDGLDKFDEYYEKGWLDRVITTNLNYRIPELLTRPYYVEANMSKYLASIMDIINHDVSVEKVRSSNEKIMDLMKRVNQ